MLPSRSRILSVTASALPLRSDHLSLYNHAPSHQFRPKSSVLILDVMLECIRGSAALPWHSRRYEGGHSGGQHKEPSLRVRVLDVALTRVALMVSSRE